MIRKKYCFYLNYKQNFFFFFDSLPSFYFSTAAFKHPENLVRHDFFHFFFSKIPPKGPIDVLKILRCDMPRSVHNLKFWFFRFPKNP